MTRFLSMLNAKGRMVQPWVGGRMYHTPAQSEFRAKQQGYYATATTGAHRSITRLRKHPTGAASMDKLEPDTTLYRSVIGSWGRPVKVGRRP